MVVCEVVEVALREHNIAGFTVCCDDLNQCQLWSCSQPPGVWMICWEIDQSLTRPLFFSLMGVVLLSAMNGVGLLGVGWTNHDRYEKPLRWSEQEKGVMLLILTSRSDHMIFKKNPVNRDGDIQQSLIGYNKIHQITFASSVSTRVVLFDWEPGFCQGARTQSGSKPHWHCLSGIVNSFEILSE